MHGCNDLADLSQLGRDVWEMVMVMEKVIIEDMIRLMGMGMGGGLVGRGGGRRE